MYLFVFLAGLYRSIVLNNVVAKERKLEPGMYSDLSLCSGMDEDAKYLCCKSGNERDYHFHTFK